MTADMRSFFSKWKFKNMSIRRTLVVLTVMAILLAVLLIAIELNFWNAIYAQVVSKYEIVSKYGAVSNYGFEMQLSPTIYTYILSETPSGVDGWIISSVPNLQLFTTLIIIGGIILGQSFLFYRLKLKKPLALLNDASDKIADNELDFHLACDSKDEMGALCVSFEKMRTSLEETNKEMWRSMEERKRLNAAFSHDLRTPLTVLRGYADLLLKYMPEDKLSKERVFSTLTTLSGHVTRLEDYVSSMNALQRLEDIVPSTAPVNLTSLALSLEETALILAAAHSLTVTVSTDFPSDTVISLDTAIVTQVFENLIANAIRYAKTALRLRFSVEEEVFLLTVCDDGAGFSPTLLLHAAEPFYRGECETEDGSHFGLGLNICKGLCEKHGGCLLLANCNDGGGQVTVSFQSKKFV